MGANLYYDDEIDKLVLYPAERMNNSYCYWLELDKIHKKWVSNSAKKHSIYCDCKGAGFGCFCLQYCTC